MINETLFLYHTRVLLDPTIVFRNRICYHTYDPDPPDKSISQGTASYEDGITYRYGTSGPPGSTVRSLAIANTSPPGSTSYSLSEGLFGAHMQGVQGKVDTSTQSVSLGMRGVRNGKHSLSDYHPYPVCGI